MKHNICKKKEYQDLRYTYSYLDLEDFEKIVIKYNRLKFQYKILEFSKKIENIKIPLLDIFLIRFFCKLLDFFRWKFYDFLIFLIQGYQFSLFGVTCYCGRQGSGKTIGVVREVERLKTIYPKAIVCTNIDYCRTRL